MDTRHGFIHNYDHRKSCVLLHRSARCNKAGNAGKGVVPGAAHLLSKGSEANVKRGGSISALVFDLLKAVAEFVVPAGLEPQLLFPAPS